MPLYRITDPNHEAVLSLSEVKAHVRIDYPDDDDLLELYRDAAIGHIDGRDGWLGRALAEQTWELRLAGFPPRDFHIVVPLPPLIEVESVKYYDPGGVLQTLDPSEYAVAGAGGFGKARIMRKANWWPRTSALGESVLVRFRAGYVTADSPPVGEVPRPIRLALLRMVATAYEHRESVVIGARAAKLPGGVEALLAPLRVW